MDWNRMNVCITDKHNDHDNYDVDLVKVFHFFIRSYFFVFVFFSSSFAFQINTVLFLRYIYLVLYLFTINTTIFMRVNFFPIFLSYLICL